MRALACLLLLAIGCGGGVEAITTCEAAEGLEPICGFQNPEDLVALPGGDWLVVSQFPEHMASLDEGGSLLAFRPRDGRRVPLFPVETGEAPAPTPGVGADACPGAPHGELFAPHGIDLAHAPGGALRLLVVNHGSREAIEIFSVSVAAQPRLDWLGCVPLPDDALANDVVALPGGALAATKFFPRDFGLLTLVRVAFGLDTGHVLVWEPRVGWEIVPGSEESAPNGIEASPDGETLFVASWGNERLIRIGRDGSDATAVSLAFHPDNLTWTSDGRLLAAGHTGSILAVRECEAISEGSCGTPFAVAVVDPETLEVATVFAHDRPTHAGAASVALEHQGSIWIGTFSGDRLLRIPAS